jgi:putative tricarboxylic transport membrane protein
MESALIGLVQALEPFNIAIMVAGLVIGVVFGGTPGLTAAAAMTMLLPLTFMLPPVAGVLFLLSIWNGAVYAGGLPAILVNIPGTPASAATAFDGYPMAQQGLAQRALRASIVASCVGSFISAAALLLLSPPLARLSLLLGPAEIFGFALFGLTAAATLSGRSRLHGLFSVALGLWLATIGLSPAGQPRMMFSADLLDGFPVLIALIGLFTIPQVLALILSRAQQVAINTEQPAGREHYLLRLRDWSESWFNMLRSSLIGVVVGVLPGAGPTIAGFISYAEAKRASKKPETFGKGNPQGVIAAESANNAAVFSDLIPSFALGIPGSVDAVIVLAALTMHNMVPGPALFNRNPEVVYTFMMGAFVSVVLLLVIGLLSMRWIAYVTRMRLSLLAPAILVFGFVGVFSIHNNPFEVTMALGIGIVGFALRLAGVPLAPLVLGMVLGPILETKLYQVIALYDHGAGVLLTRPISLAFIVASALSVLWPLLRRKRTGEPIADL